MFVEDDRGFGKAPNDDVENVYNEDWRGSVNSTLTIIYEWSDDGWWVAEVAEVPGAFSQGRTKEEAKANALDALRELLLARHELALRQATDPANVEVVSLAA